MPRAAVLVATARALKYHGGAARDALGREDLGALERGLVNLERHYQNITTQYGLPCVVCINHFTADTPAELALIEAKVASLGGRAVVARHWAEGGAGAEALAEAVVAAVADNQGEHRYVYADDLPLWDKIKAVATHIYGAADITADAKVRAQINELNAQWGHLPVCMAKTQMSFSTDPAALGAPSGHTVNLREVRLAAGAGFVVVIAGDLMTMPGLPKVPAAEHIDVDAHGNISGLF